MTRRRIKARLGAIVLPGIFCVVFSCLPLWAVGDGNDLLPDAPVGLLSLRFEVFTTLPSGLPVSKITNAGDGSGRLFLVSPSGSVWIHQNGAVLATPFLNTPSSPSDRAMSSIAFHPDFATNGRLYVITGEVFPNASTPHYSAPQNDTGSAFDSVLYEYQVDASDPNQVDLSTRRELLRVHQANRLHNMGDLAFEGNGLLCIALGDGGPTRSGGPTNYQTNAQQTDSPFGAVLRIDVDTIGPNGRYGIPGTNPFPTGACPEIFAWGFRNPWRMSADRMTGEIYVGDNGDITVESVLRVESGNNFGWADREGGFLWNPSTGEATVDPNPDPTLAPALARYDHNWSTVAHGSIIGGFVYRGSALPELQGRYLFLDWLAADVMAVDPSTGGLEIVTVDPTGVALVPTGQITWGEDEAGELYVGRTNGEVLKVLPVGVPFLRGDGNVDGVFNVGDMVHNLAYQFQAGAGDCIDALDVNDDGGIDVSDPVYGLAYLFSTGLPLPAPFPDCGSDPTPDLFDCQNPFPCP